MQTDVSRKPSEGVRETALFLLILAAGAVLYTYRLSWSDIWIDESCSKALARHSLADLIRLIAHDSHPPLYFIGLKGFMSVVGYSDLTLRLFSVVGALGTLILGYVMGQRVFGRRGALVLTAVLLALPMPALYAHVARMYTWSACLVLGVFLTAVQVGRDSRRMDIVWLGLFSVLAAYTHYYALIAAFWINFCLLLYLVVQRNPRWRAVVLMGLIVFVLYLPWAFVLGSQSATVRKDFWIPPVSWQSVAECYTRPFGGFYSLNALSWVPIVAIYGLTVACIVVVLATPKSEDRLPVLLALVGFHATLLSATVISLSVRPILYPRYIMTIAPLLAVPPAVLLTRCRSVWIRGGVLAVLIGCGVPIVFSETKFSYGPYQQALRSLAQRHPEVVKILHINELTTGPFSEYASGTRWKNYYLKNDRASWYSNMEMFDGATPVRDLAAMTEEREVFCLVEFSGFWLNRPNIDLVLSQCDLIAVENAADEKPYPGIVLKLYLLRARK